MWELYTSLSMWARLGIAFVLAVAVVLILASI